MSAVTIAADIDGDSIEVRVEVPDVMGDPLDGLDRALTEAANRVRRSYGIPVPTR